MNQLMYRKRDDLAQLVQAMSGGEKRYFKGFSKAFTAKGEEPLYQQLFGLLENGKSELQNHFSGQTEKSLTTTKKRLYQNILKSLRLFHQERSVAIRLHNLLSEIEILYTLGLAGQSLFLLLKAHKLAKESEEFGLLLKILEWESRLNVVLDTPTRTQSEIVEEEALVMRQQQQFRILENIFVQAEVLKKKHGFVKGELQSELERETLRHANMPELSGCLSRKAEYYYHFVHALYYWMTLDHQSAYKFSQRLVNPAITSLSPGDYINGLLEHITSCVCMGRFKDALHAIDVAGEYIETEKLSQSPAFSARVFAYRSTCLLVMYNYMGKRKKLIETIRWTEQELAHFDHVLPFESKQVIIGNLMNAYMGVGDLAKADQVWDSIFNKQSRAIRRDIYADLHLFRLFSLLTSKGYELLIPAAEAALRYFRKFEDNRQIFEVEIPIALLLQRDHGLERKETLREVIEQISAMIRNFISSLPGDGYFQEHYTRYLIWCDAILHEQPFYRASEKWYKVFRP